MKKQIVLFFFQLSIFFTLLSGKSFAQSIGVLLDGENDLVTIPDHSSYNLGAGDFTIEAWIKADVTQGFFPLPAIISKWSFSSPGFILFLDAGQLAFQVGGVSLSKAGPDLLDNSCHHVAVTRTGTTINYYVDGINVLTQSGYGQSISAPHDLWIGSTAPGPNNFRGLIHDVRYWNIGRTQTEIQASKDTFLIGTETGLIGYWRMNDGSGQSVDDYSMLNNAGILGHTLAVQFTDPLFSSPGCIVSCLPPAAIITADGPTIFCSGGSVTLNASTGAGVSYQWQLNGADISGATSSSFYTTTGGNFRCIVTNSCLSIISNSIKVSADTALPIASASSDSPVCTGSSIKLSSSGGLSYSWIGPEGDLQPIQNPFTSSGAVETSRTYTVTVTNGCGSSTATTTVIINACTNHMTMSLQNCTQPTPNTIEFDLYAVSDGPPASDLRAAAFQYGINFNTGILQPGATASLSYIAGTSDFIPPLNGFSMPASPFLDHVRVIQSPYQGGNTGITMVVGHQYRVGRFRLTSSSNWVPNSNPNFILNTTVMGGRNVTAAVVWKGATSFLSNIVVTGTGSNQRSLSVTCSAVLNPCSVSAFTTATPVCIGGSNGTATASPSGGLIPYTYLWNNGQTSQTATGLVAGSYSVTVTDAGGCTITAAATVIVNNSTSLNLKLFSEGYYTAGGMMKPVMANQNVSGATGTQTDTIYIELHDVTDPGIIVESRSVVLMTNGTATASFSSSISCNSYWIAVKHRNMIQTWSAAPVLFSPATNYDFTTASSKAYGHNMIELEAGVRAFYIGDFNQDENVDLLEFPELDYAIDHGFFGYYTTDMNGDGNVDIIDFPLFQINVIDGRFSYHP